MSGNCDLKCYKVKKQGKGLPTDGSAFSIEIARRGCSELIFRDLSETKDQIT